MRARQAACALLLGLSAAAQAQPRRDFAGFFSLQLPASMQPQAGGIGGDSFSGHLSGDGLRLDYDLGISADPLKDRDGGSAREERPLMVNGLPARLVRWRVEQPAPTRYFLGLHLPRIGMSSAGPIRLTLLAHGTDLAKVDEAQAMLLSLRMAAAGAANEQKAKR
jgi:hypothetical protein